MKSVVIHEGGRVSVERHIMPKIQHDDEVLVKVIYSGLCGSDIPRIFAKGAHFYPITLGHEFSGEVAEVGASVTDLSVGNIVSCVPLLPCFKCPSCQKYHYSLCKHYQFVGSRQNGGNAEYIVVKRNNLLKLPETVSALEGAFFEPITVSIHALLLAGGCKDKNVVIVGVGTIGLLALQCARALGAATVTAIDINEHKLRLAQNLGASHVYNSLILSADEIFQQLQPYNDNQLIMEIAGSPKTVNLSLQIAGPKAQIVLVGTLHQDLTLSYPTFSLILRKELTLLGSWMNYSAPWPGLEWAITADLFAQKKMVIEPLIASVSTPEKFVEIIGSMADKPIDGKLLIKF